MFEQFTNYPDLKWTDSTAMQFYGTGDKIQIFPDLDNFKLERFEDFRDEPAREENEPFKVMLIGTSKTNILIDGPDSLVNILISRLPQYIGKSWSEILGIKFEEILQNCNNFLISSRCNPWIIDKFKMKEISQSRKISYLTTNDLSKADEICVKCDNFIAQ